MLERFKDYMSTIVWFTIKNSRVKAAKKIKCFSHDYRGQVKTGFLQIGPVYDITC